MPREIKAELSLKLPIWWKPYLGLMAAIARLGVVIDPKQIAENIAASTKACIKWP